MVSHARRALRGSGRGGGPRLLGAVDVLPPGEDTGGARHRLFDAVNASLSDERGARLAIDDPHWADQWTLLPASFLPRSQPADRCAHRPPARRRAAPRRAARARRGRRRGTRALAARRRRRRCARTRRQRLRPCRTRRPTPRCRRSGAATLAVLGALIAVALLRSRAQNALAGGGLIPPAVSGIPGWGGRGARGPSRAWSCRRPARRRRP